MAKIKMIKINESVLQNNQMSGLLDSELNYTIIGLGIGNVPVYASHLIIKHYHQQVKEEDFEDLIISENDDVATFEEAYCALLFLKNIVLSSSHPQMPIFCDDYIFLKNIYDTVELGGECEFDQIPDLNIHITPRENEIEFHGFL